MSVNISLFAGAGWQFFDNNGVPLAGGLIYTYAAGTTTPQTTYTTITGNIANANPIVLDSAGRVPNEIWLTSTLVYKFLVKTSVGTQIASYDNIAPAADSATLAASSGSSLIGFIQSGTGAVAETVQTKLRESVSVKDFGAVGDGVTDDSTAINAAINAATNIYFPETSSSYYVASPIIVTLGKNLYGIGKSGASILGKRGAPVIWCQQGDNTISGLKIKFPNTASSSTDIGIRLRNTASFDPPNTDSNWVYVFNIIIEKCLIQYAYTSIEMEAVYNISIKDVDTDNDTYGIALNKAQDASHGGASFSKVATTMFLQRVYCHGSQSNAIITGSYGMWMETSTNLTIDSCTTEWYDTAAYLGNISNGSLSNHYLEECGAGVQILGNGADFLVSNPYAVRNTTAMPYAFRGNNGNIVFSGGQYSANNSGAAGFFSPISATGTATFLTLPIVTGYASILSGATTFKTGGLDSSGALVTGYEQCRTDGQHFGLFTTGVAQTISRTVVSGGMAVVTGYSLTGAYQALVLIGNAAAIVGTPNNTTGGTVTFAISGSTLTMTSTGTSAQVLQEAWVMTLTA
tara:strand:+ start:391 stop:2112 length:1722 start_codon:yes stop_codon:yes gene_type:complete